MVIKLSQLTSRSCQENSKAYQSRCSKEWVPSTLSYAPEAQVARGVAFSRENLGDGGSEEKLLASRSSLWSLGQKVPPHTTQGCSLPSPLLAYVWPGLASFLLQENPIFPPKTDSSLRVGLLFVDQVGCRGRVQVRRQAERAWGELTLETCQVKREIKMCPAHGRVLPFLPVTLFHKWRRPRPRKGAGLS